MTRLLAQPVLHPWPEHGAPSAGPLIAAELARADAITAGWREEQAARAARPLGEEWEPGRYGDLLAAIHVEPEPSMRERLWWLLEDVAALGAILVLSAVGLVLAGSLL